MAATTTTTPSPDLPILIAGAGPAGLALACALADAGRPSLVLEPQAESELAQPPDDGREIALTQRSIRLLKQLQLWDDLAPHEIAPLRSAHVFDAGGPARLDFHPDRGDALGALVPNHALRRIAFNGLKTRPLAQLRCGQRAQNLWLDDPQAALLRLESGETLRTPLLAAADGRFSTLRRLAGISTRLLDFGRSALLIRVRHSDDHAGQALECFHTGHTMAWLPVADPHESSLVLTLPSAQAQTLHGWDDAQLLDWLRRHAQQRRGDLLGVGARHVYPLVACYAERFVKPRLALLGDAAVGMHPVTAHGFNLGLAAAADLAQRAAPAGDPGDLSRLLAFQSAHRCRSLGLYESTNALVRLYTSDRPPLRPLRQGLLKLAQKLPPLKLAITSHLTDPA